VLYKPSEYATLTGLHITRLLHEAGVPKDVMTALVARARSARARRATVDGVFFTAATPPARASRRRSGRLRQAAARTRRKDPSYVRARRCESRRRIAADGAMYNTGQSCCAVERIYVHESLHDEFVRHFVATVDGFKLGDPMDEATHRRDHARAAACRARSAGRRREGEKERPCSAAASACPPGNWFETERVHERRTTGWR